MSEFVFEEALNCKRAEKNINDQQLEFMHRYLNVCEKVTDADLKSELRMFCFGKIHEFIQFVKNMETLKDRVDDLERMEMSYIIDKFVREFFSMRLKSDNQDADATGAFDPETIGAAEALEKACKELEAYKPDITELMNADEAEKGKDMESAQYDEESDGYKYSAAEIAQKLNVLSQYCDIELKDTCTIADIAEFLENVHLDANGNVWLMVQIDEYTFKRFRLNREAAGQITM